MQSCICWPWWWSAIRKISRANITNTGCPHHYQYIWDIAAENIRNKNKYICNQQNQQCKHHKYWFSPSLSIYLGYCRWKYQLYIYTSAIRKIRRANITHIGSAYHYQYIWDIVAENISNMYKYQRSRKISRVSITSPLLRVGIKAIILNHYLSKGVQSMHTYSL